MTFLTCTLVSLLAAAVVSVAAATAAPKDPSVMILRQADIPRSQYEASDDLDDYLRRPLKAAGLSGRVAAYLAQTYSEQKGLLQISGLVLTVDRPADARKVFTITTKARDRFLRRSPGGWTSVSLAGYGDQQRALIDPPGSEGIAHAELIVRRATSVWLLYITLERRPKPPVSDLVAGLKRYAAKQKLRIGAG
jgi:hypothetical protein